MTMVSMLPLGDREYESKINQAIHKYLQRRAGERDIHGVLGAYNSSAYDDPKLFEEVLKNEQHEMRLHSWVNFALQCYEVGGFDKTFYIQNIDSQENTLT